MKCQCPSEAHGHKAGKCKNEATEGEKCEHCNKATCWKYRTPTRPTRPSRAGAIDIRHPPILAQRGPFARLQLGWASGKMATARAPSHHSKNNPGQRGD
jgi:hypothetical protein